MLRFFYEIFIKPYNQIRKRATNLRSRISIKDELNLFSYS